MLGEKSIILAHLKKLRADDPAKAWRLLSAGIGSAIGMAAAIAVAPGTTTAPTTTETVVEQLTAVPAVVRRDDTRPFIREDRIKNGESYMIGMHIAPLASASSDNNLVSPKVLNIPMLLDHAKPSVSLVMVAAFCHFSASDGE